MTSIAIFGGCGENYAFKVVDDGDGSVSVLAGSVNALNATGLTPGGKPDQLWLKVTVNEDGDATAAEIGTQPGTQSETLTSRSIATITWSGDANNTPAIVQGIKGSQNLVSCGNNHGWSSLYL